MGGWTPTTSNSIPNTTLPDYQPTTNLILLLHYCLDLSYYLTIIAQLEWGGKPVEGGRSEAPHAPMLEARKRRGGPGGSHDAADRWGGKVGGGGAFAGGFAILRYRCANMES